MRRIEEKPEGVPAFIWKIYEECWAKYSEANADFPNRGNAHLIVGYQAELAVVERIMKGFPTPKAYTNIRDWVFGYHRKMDLEAGVPTTEEVYVSTNANVAERRRD